MEQIKFKEATHNLGAPDSMSSDECGSLPVCACTVKYEDGREFLAMVSCWQLTAVDLQTVNKTGKLFLTVYGDSHPVVALTVGNPVTGEVPEPSDVVVDLMRKRLEEMAKANDGKVYLQYSEEMTLDLPALNNEPAKFPTFEEELRQLINRHGIDTKARLADYTLVEQVIKYLKRVCVNVHLTEPNEPGKTALV